MIEENPSQGIKRQIKEESKDIEEIIEFEGIQFSFVENKVNFFGFTCEETQRLKLHRNNIIKYLEESKG